MNSTSLESRHSQYRVPPLPAAESQVQAQSMAWPQGLNLTSTPKYSFKAPTAEDFNKGTQAYLEHPVPNSTLSVLASLWSKLSRRP